jgi:uncharacterized RDD family membrane protein YckC
LSTSVVQPDFTPAWKQEVSRRLAAHKSRRGLPAAKPVVFAQSWQSASSRAAQAAARVAARYADAPSYSQLLFDDAPAVPRVEVAPQQVMTVQAIAQAMQAASAGPRLLEPEVPQPARPPVTDWEPSVPLVRLAAPSSLEAWEREYLHARLEPEFTLRPLETAAAREQRPAEVVVSRIEEEWDRPALVERLPEVEAIEFVEPVVPIHANLIEFPRELIATRKMRPRRAEGAFAADGTERQLSIFEVYPSATSIETAVAGDESVAVWPEPEWSGIELEDQPMDEAETEDAEARLAVQVAPIGNRLISALVDGAIIAGAFLGLALVAAVDMGHPPAARILEFSAASALLLIGLAYHTFFLTLGEATPGMRFAGVSLCTFDGQIPTRAQLRGRLGALLLSLLPVGLGVVWVLLDDAHLSWHDRLSKTYLRKY